VFSHCIFAQGLCQPLLSGATPNSDDGGTLWQSCRLTTKDNEDTFMTITRIDAEARWSDVVIHNQTLYYTGVPANLDADAFEQTANTLAQIDAVLEKQGSDKSRILDATIFLANKDDFAAMNKAWDAWVVAGHAPVRCTVQATLMKPEYKVEIKIIAAV
jgi:enamine deaminase RidA (YjgF/YER057c/UK114 family)